MREAANKRAANWNAADGVASSAAVPRLNESAAPALKRRFGPALRRAVTAADPLRFLGLILFVLAWHALSLFFEPIILPPPLAVLNRLLADFWDAPNLSYYGVAEPNLYANLIYTAQNVAIAVFCGDAPDVIPAPLPGRPA